MTPSAENPFDTMSFREIKGEFIEIIRGLLAQTSSSVRGPKPDYEGAYTLERYASLDASDALAEILRHELLRADDESLGQRFPSSKEFFDAVVFELDLYEPYVADPICLMLEKKLKITIERIIPRQRLYERHVRYLLQVTELSEVEIREFLDEGRLDKDKEKRLVTELADSEILARLREAS